MYIISTLCILRDVHKSTEKSRAPVRSSGPTGQADSHRYTGRKKDEKRCLTQRRKGAKGGNAFTDSENENNLSNRCNLRINVCDAEAYEFNRIIGVFRESGIRPGRAVISVPLSVVWVATRIAGCFFRNKREWVYSCYDKLAGDLVFDNGRMMGMGF